MCDNSPPISSRSFSKRVLNFLMSALGIFLEVFAAAFFTTFLFALFLDFFILFILLSLNVFHTPIAEGRMVFVFAHRLAVIPAPLTFRAFCLLDPDLDRKTRPRAARIRGGVLQ